MPEDKQTVEAAEAKEEKTEQVAQEPVAEKEPVSLEALASEMGWMPQEKFKGPAEKWKSADQFIRDGKDIQDRLSREVKTVRETLDTIKATNASILHDRLKEQHEQLTRRYTAAVEKGDPEEAFKLGTEILRVKDAVTTAGRPSASPAPETQAWVERNAKVKADPVAWRDALQICDAYAREYPHSSVQEQLSYTEQHLKSRYPQLFDDKPAPQVNGNINRNTSTQGGRAKTASDLPREARDMAKDLVERGLIKSEDDYAKNYFAAQARKAVQ